MRPFTSLGLFTTVNFSLLPGLFPINKEKWMVVLVLVLVVAVVAAGLAAVAVMVFFLHYLLGVTHARWGKLPLLGSLTLSARTCTPRPAVLQAGLRPVTK